MLLASAVWTWGHYGMALQQVGGRVFGVTDASQGVVWHLWQAFGVADGGGHHFGVRRVLEGAHGDRQGGIQFSIFATHLQLLPNCGHLGPQTATRQSWRDYHDGRGRSPGFTASGGGRTGWDNSSTADR